METGGSENIGSFAGGLWAVHGAADLPVTKKVNFCWNFSVLFFCVVKPLYEQFFVWNCNNCIFFIRIN